jgi:lysophospholipase L1-like esterase
VGEGFEVLDGGEGVLEGAGVPGVAFVTEVDDAGGDGDLLGGFEGSLDLIHGGDAVGLLGIDEIDVGGDVTGPLAGSAVGEVDGLVERGSYSCVAEPGGDVANGGAVGVVEVVAGGEELDRLGAGFVEGVEQTGMEALLKEDVGGEGRLHHLLKYSRCAFDGWRCGLWFGGAVDQGVLTSVWGFSCKARSGDKVAADDERTERMMSLRSAVLSGCMSLMVVTGWSQTGPAPAPVDTAKQIATMEAKLADWPQLGRYRADNATLGAAESGRVVFYGDSITDGWGRQQNTGEFFPGKPYVNRGIGGQTTPQMVVRFRQDVIDLHPAAVVILAGTNDVAGNTGPMTPEMTENNFRSMVDLAKANGIRVIVASITPATDFPWRKGLMPAAKIKALNDWLKGYCVMHSVTYLDYYSALADQNGGMKDGTSFDGVHPNAAGYAIMGPLAQAAIDKTLGGK